MDPPPLYCRRHSQRHEETAPETRQTFRGSPYEEPRDEVSNGKTCTAVRLTAVVWLPLLSLRSPGRKRWRRVQFSRSSLCCVCVIDLCQTSPLPCCCLSSLQLQATLFACLPGWHMLCLFCVLLYACSPSSITRPEPTLPVDSSAPKCGAQRC